jgi:voltage-gated potassium channel
MRLSHLSDEEREAIVSKIEAKTELPLLVLVIIMIITLVTPLVIKLDHQTTIFLEIIDWIIWAIFFLELSARTFFSTKRFSYLKKNWIDVLVVILPFLRIFRVFRVARLARGARAVRALRFIRIISVFSKFTHELKNIFSKHGFHYLVAIFIGVIVIGTILVYNFEQSSIIGAKNIAESLWLVITNAFSGGFANIYPETPEAKTMAILIIIIGNVLVSYFTASLASYFSEKDQDVEQERIEKKLDFIIKEMNKNEKRD